MIQAALALAIAAASATGTSRPPPSHREPDWRSVAHYLDSVVASGAAPGAVVAISWHGQHFTHGAGHLGQELPDQPDGRTIYDLASLTKVIGLTTMVKLAVDERRLELDSPITRWVPAFRGPGKDLVTLRHLLTHSSGLPGWRHLYDSTATRAEAMALALLPALLLLARRAARKRTRERVVENQRGLLPLDPEREGLHLGLGQRRGLKSDEDGDPAKTDQYERWRAMRKQQRITP